MIIATQTIESTPTVNEEGRKSGVCAVGCFACVSLRAQFQSSFHSLKCLYTSLSSSFFNLKRNSDDIDMVGHVLDGRERMQNEKGKLIGRVQTACTAHGPTQSGMRR